MVFGHDFRHDHSHLVRRIKFACLLAGTGGEIADEKFIDIAEYVVVLGAVGGDVLDEIDEFPESFGLRSGVVAELAETFTQGFEDAAINGGKVGIQKAVEIAQCRAQRGNIEVGIFPEPGGEEVFIGNEEADFVLAFLDGLFHVFIIVVFHEVHEFFFLPATVLGEVFHFGVGDKLIEDETEDIVFIFVGGDFAAHAVGRSPDAVGKLLFVHIG